MSGAAGAVIYSIAAGLFVLILLVSHIIQRRNAALSEASAASFLGLDLSPLTAEDKNRVAALKQAMSAVQIAGRRLEGRVGTWECEMIAARMRGDAEDLKKQALEKRQEASTRYRLIGILLGRTGLLNKDFDENELGCEESREHSTEGIPEDNPTKQCKDEEEDSVEETYEDEKEAERDAPQGRQSHEGTSTSTWEKKGPHISKSEEYVVLAVDSEDEHCERAST